MTIRVTFGLFLFLSLVPAAWSAPGHDRVARKIGSTASFKVKGNVHPMAQSVYDHGKVDGQFRLERITMMFKSTDAQEAELAALLERQQNPSSPDFHKWLAPEEFADRFGLSANDVEQIVSWLRDQGFTVNEQARSRRSVTFTGSAAQVERVFRTPIHQYTVDGESFYANAADPYVPDALADVVLGFRSLNNFQLKPRSRMMRVNDLSSQFTSSTSGNHFVSPYDFATIYNLHGLYASGFDGTGQKIAVMGQTNIALNDIRAFRSASGLPPNDPQVVLVPGSADPGTNTGDVTEADLDIEWAGAIAKNAQIIYVTSKNGVMDSLQYAIQQNLAPVISISYGSCERTFTTQDVNMLASLAQQANAQGTTIVAAAGDTGAADCDHNARVASRGLAVDVPASLPFVTGMGGSEFSEVSNSWSSANNSSNGSAISYIPETTWNNSSTTNTLSAGGGGRSTYFAKPTWQSANGVPDDKFRDVPDLSLSSSPQHDGYLICALGSCVSGFRTADGSLNVIGGTSAAAPAFAGVVAVLNQATHSLQGNINPALYRLAGLAPSAFHDITTGGNQVPCRLGTIDCVAGGSIGYAAGVGYDLATGLGSIDASSLVNAWPLLTSSTVPTTPPPPDPANTPVVRPQTIADVEGGTVRSGYAVITPDASSSAPGAMATFGMVSGGNVQAEAGITAAAPASASSLLVDVNTSIGRNLAVAVVNPGDTPNVITLTLRDSNGATVATTTLTVPAKQQIARFVSELFGSGTFGTAFSGNLYLQAQSAFLLLALRFSGIEFSTLPVIGSGTPGQSSSTTLPQFAIGGGWATQIALVNTGSAIATGRIDIFDSSGNPMAVKLNNTTQTSFRYSVAPGGTFILAPRDVNGLSPL